MKNYHEDESSWKFCQAFPKNRKIKFNFSHFLNRHEVTLSIESLDTKLVFASLNKCLYFDFQHQSSYKNLSWKIFLKKILLFKNNFPLYLQKCENTGSKSYCFKW